MIAKKRRSKYLVIAFTFFISPLTLWYKIQLGPLETLVNDSHRIWHNRWKKFVLEDNGNGLVTEHHCSFYPWLLLSLSPDKHRFMVFLQVYDKGNRCIIDKIQYHRLGTSNLFERFMVIRWKIHLEVTSTHLKRELNSKTQWISQCFPIIWPGCKKYLRKAFFQLLKPKIHRQLEVSSVKFVSHS